MELLPNGRLVETAEEVGAMLDVRAFHFGKYRGEDWLTPSAPAISIKPGIEKLHDEVTPSPSSNQARYGSTLGISYGLNSKGRKSHRPTKVQLEPV